MTNKTYRTGLQALPLALLLGAAPAFAQAPAPAQPAQAQAPASPQPGVSLAVTPPSAEHLGFARELLSQIGAERLIETVVSNMVARLSQTVTATRPELTNDLKAVMDSIRPEFDKQTPLVVEDAARVFSRAMTEQELRETVTFLKSPAGQKYLDTQGQSVSMISSMMEQWSRQLSQQMFEKARAEMKKKGHDI